MAKKAAAKKPDHSSEMYERTVKASNKDLKKISELITRFEVLAQERAALLRSADELWEEMLKIERQTMPQVLTEAGTRDFTDAGSGIHVELDSYLSGTWPKDATKLDKAIKWLKKVKAEHLLKAELIGKFSRSDAKLARDFFEKIKKTGKATVEIKERVHPQTLLAFFRERLKAGKEVPFDIFDGETGTFARIDFPKDKSEKEEMRRGKQQKPKS